MNKNKLCKYDSIILLCVISCCLICCFLSSCAVEKGTIYKKDGKLYGITDGLFKSEWDDYYHRGISYVEGGFWNDAAIDFTKAIEKRARDQRRARTYGMHFIDYFPNRELGIANFNLGKYKEAIRHLETSLASVETARAKFYLNKARRSWLNETRLDTVPPAIRVQFPPPVYRTNDFSISVEGKVRDDFFVSNIIFNGRSSRLELSRKEVSFKEEFLLHHGKNVITLQSEDILGKTSQPVTIQVKVDREGPLVFLEVKDMAGGSIIVTGAIYDKSAIARIALGDKVLVFKETQLIAVNEDFSSRGLTADAPIPFEVEDIVGNKTTGYIQVSASKNIKRLSAYPRMAFAQIAGSFPLLPIMTLPQISSFEQRADTRATSQISAIDLKGLRDGQTMFLNILSVEGAVRSNEGIDDITINGESLISLEDDSEGASFLKLLKEKKGRPLAFSKLIQLKEGENTITTSLADRTGMVMEKAIAITRKIPRVRQMGARMTAAIFPFTGKKDTKEPLRNYVYTFLTHSFEYQKRFNVLGRDKLNRVLEAQEISRDKTFDQKMAISLGQLMGSETVLIGNISLGSETVLIGDISASQESIEILARLVDTGTSIILAEKDIYWEGGIDSGFRENLDALALKFKQHLPLCEGTVIDEKSGRVVIDLGENELIRQGM
ncbi:MAG: hypothetical protein JRE20_14310, partial [Deltaproteobacteria bacterium]|nr:hypothetical protein [Deltaproteobacteria bacterium]